MFNLGFHVLNAPKASNELKKFCRREERGRRFRFRYNANVGFDLLRVLDSVHAKHLNPTFAGTKLPGEEFDERGFSSAVWSKHPEEFPGVDFYVERMKSDEITVFLRHVHGADHRFFAPSHKPWISF